MHPDAETTAAPAYAGNETVGKLASKRPSELERLANSIAKQAELIMMLEGRLNMVSDRTPEDKQHANRGDSAPHLSTLIDFVGDNNSELQRLINQLVL